MPCYSIIKPFLTILAFHSIFPPLFSPLYSLPPHSRRSSWCTIWFLQRCWPSLRTPPTSCWSSLRISATCSETPHCTARPSSSPAPPHPTTTPGRSREGTEETHFFIRIRICTSMRIVFPSWRPHTNSQKCDAKSKKGNKHKQLM